MVVSNIFWRRQKRARNEYPDVYQYNTLPEGFRVQIVQMWLEDLCSFASVVPQEYFGNVVRTLRREFEVWRLPPTKPNAPEDYSRELIAFFMEEQNIEKALSVIELTFVEASLLPQVNELHRNTLSFNQRTQLIRAVEELNQRFQDHGLGFQLENEQIMRMDSEFTHVEVVKPVLKLLNQKSRFLAGAENEFFIAHKLYRKGKYKDAIVWCNKAFESTMKAICVKRKWMPTNDAQKATAAQLVKKCVAEGLLPEFWETKYRDGLAVMLKHGVPSGRNNLGSHGQGEQITDVQNHTVSYMLNMTAAAIKFLCEQEEQLA